MAEQIKLNTVLIVRNDGITAWEDASAYKLQKGELGIGYLPNGNVIVRSGVDGQTAWANCPQVEGVLEKDLILTYNFGRHTTSNGFVNAGGKNMTVGEWLEDALSVTEEPEITKPTTSMSASFTPSSGEAGTAITAVNWNGTFTDGTYEYGSVETKDFPNGTDAEKAAKKAANTSVSWNIKFGNTAIGTSEDGSYAQSLVMSDSAVQVALSAEATLNTTNARTPLNNVGVETEGKITTFSDGTTKRSHTPTASVTGYRKMFVGSATEELSSSVIRALNLKSAQASATAFEVTAKIGATNLVIACPTNSQGYKYTLSKAEMFTMSYEDYTAKFVEQAQIDVADARGGANGLQKYNIYVYEFEPLKADTKFKITLKSAKN